MRLKRFSSTQALTDVCPSLAVHKTARTFIHPFIMADAGPKLEDVRKNLQEAEANKTVAHQTSLPSPMREEGEHGAGPWDGNWLYSRTVHKYTGHATPFEQMGLAASAYGVIHGGRSVMQSVHIMKAASSPVGSEDQLMYSYLGKGE